MLGDVQTLSISEVFGPTFQGEGPSIGRRCGFVRLGKCNLTCSWCDTPYTWDWRGVNGKRFDPKVELRRMSVGSVVEQLLGLDVDMAVLTGGEPLLQQEGLAELASALTAEGLRVEVETNGTIRPIPEVSDAVTHFNVGLKLSNSGVARERRIVPDAVDALQKAGGAFKFVAASELCLDEIDDLVLNFTIQPSNVWVMPEGRTPAEINLRLENFSDAVLDRGYNVTTRLHVLLWGDERGR